MSGVSKGYAFIRFATEEEQQGAIVSMNGMTGCGGKPLKVRQRKRRE